MRIFKQIAGVAMIAVTFGAAFLWNGETKPTTITDLVPKANAVIGRH